MTFEKIEPYLQQIADKLGQGAEFTWEVVVRQQYLEGWLSLGMLGVGIIGFLLGLWIGTKSDLSDKKDFLEGVAVIMIIICGTLTLAGFILFFQDGYTQIMNPEYHAIMDIIEPIKGQQAN